MLNKQKHRGPNPRDYDNFAPDVLPQLRNAVDDYSNLLNRGYAPKAALKLVGDHFQFTSRQRLAIYRASCTQAQATSRLSKLVAISELGGQTLLIDGLNTIITLEAALSKAYLIRCMDHCCRDMSEVYSNYRLVEETPLALELISNALDAYQTASAVWFIDKPVSNSKRLADLIEAHAARNNLNWQVQLSNAADSDIIKLNDEGIVVSSDSILLDRCTKWTNLCASLIKQKIHSAIMLDLC